MADKKRYTQSELRHIGHHSLSWEWWEWDPASDDCPTTLEVIGVGLLATLLRIADDISTLATVAWREREI